MFHALPTSFLQERQWSGTAPHLITIPDFAPSQIRILKHHFDGQAGKKAHRILFNGLFSDSVSSFNGCRFLMTSACSPESAHQIPWHWNLQHRILDAASQQSDVGFCFFVGFLGFGVDCELAFLTSCIWQSCKRETVWQQERVGGLDFVVGVWRLWDFCGDMGRRVMQLAVLECERLQDHLAPAVYASTGGYLQLLQKAFNHVLANASTILHPQITVPPSLSFTGWYACSFSQLLCFDSIICFPGWSFVIWVERACILKFCTDPGWDHLC